MLVADDGEAGEHSWRRAHRRGGDAGDREEPAAGGG